MTPDELIAKHLPIAWAIKDHDARSEALLKLVIVARSLGPDVRDPTAVIATVMKNAAWWCVEGQIRERENRQKMWRQLHELATKDVVTDQAEAADTLAAICFDDVDREIVALKLLDYTNVEVARKLGMSKQAVGIRLHQMRERL